MSATSGLPRTSLAAILVVCGAAGCSNKPQATAAPATATAAEAPKPVAGGKEQYFPLQSYRVGPYAAGGSGFFGGFIDYLQLVNARDGGVNGVKLTWNECET